MKPVVRDRRLGKALPPPQNRTSHPLWRSRLTSRPQHPPKTRPDQPFTQPKPKMRTADALPLVSRHPVTSDRMIGRRLPSGLEVTLSSPHSSSRRHGLHRSMPAVLMTCRVYEDIRARREPAWNSPG